MTVFLTLTRNWHIQLLLYYLIVIIFLTGSFDVNGGALLENDSRTRGGDSDHANQPRGI